MFIGMENCLEDVGIEILDKLMLLSGMSLELHTAELLALLLLQAV